MYVLVVSTCILASCFSLYKTCPICGDMPIPSSCQCELDHADVSGCDLEKMNKLYLTTYKSLGDLFYMRPVKAAALVGCPLFGIAVIVLIWLSALA